MFAHGQVKDMKALFRFWILLFVRGKSILFFVTIKLITINKLKSKIILRLAKRGGIQYINILLICAYC